MPEHLTVKASVEAVLSEAQAKYFASSIFAGLKTYVKEHQNEYLQYMEQYRSAGKNSEG